MRLLLRGVFVAVVGLLLGGVVHIASLLALPYLAPRDAYARLAALGPANTFIALDREDAAKRLPLQDPAFLYLACRFDLTSGPLDIRVPLASDYVTASFYGRDSVAFFAVNDRSSLGTNIDIDLHSVDDEERTEGVSAGAISVAAPDQGGFIIVRAFAPTESLIASVRAGLAAATCK